MVMCALILLVSFTTLFQPPPLIEYFPVLHYVVSYNTSDNSTVQIQLSFSISSYTVSSEPGVTYYITVRAVNAVGTGVINGYTIVNGEINKNLIFIALSPLFSATASCNHCNTILN